MTGQQLKNSILQMAVQGKLVPQDPNDEPASVLLERIRKEKEQLIKEGKIKKEKNPSYIFRGADNLPYEKVGKNEPVCIADEVPFDIPESWEWVRWGTLSESIQYGYNAPAQETGRIKMVRISDIQNNSVLWETVPYCEIKESEIDTYLLKPNDILFARTGGTVGKSYLVQDVPEEAIYAGYLIRTRYSDQLCPQYLKYFMESELYWSQLREGTIATAQPNCNGKTLGNMFVPIPPLSEQIRIVGKINVVMGSVAEYDVVYSKAEYLNDAFPDTLKKSILQEAVQGKLVPQDPADEPASVLLERIRAEKEQLIKEGKIKRDKHESVIFRRDNSHYEKLDGIERCIDDEIPFEIPDSWEWTRFGQVISLLSGTDFKPEEYNDARKGTPYITGASSLSDDGILLNRWTETPRVIANRGDVLLVCKGSGYGKTVICDIEEAHIARQIMAIKKLVTLDMRYIRLFLQANFDKIKSKGQGVIPGIDRSSVMNLLFPIPPLAEQRRIVEKQRELFDKITLI
ncbi:restriction endonuclease subunit S [Blautia sp. HCP28S3_G10]|uniref:restriction endonuclease subunit S n=1 Tax=Blautia sp. HCP28S3_G10 TaxID=3438908 RepID=UPI003F8B46A8